MLIGIDRAIMSHLFLNAELSTFWLVQQTCCWNSTYKAAASPRGRSPRGRGFAATHGRGHVRTTINIEMNGYVDQSHFHHPLTHLPLTTPKSSWGVWVRCEIPDNMSRHSRPQVPLADVCYRYTRSFNQCCRICARRRQICIWSATWRSADKKLSCRRPRDTSYYWIFR